MKIQTYRSNKKAFVLSLVLWISAAMMLLSLLFVRLSKEETKTYKDMHTKLAVELESQSLFERLSFYISTGVFQTNIIKGNLDNFPEYLTINASEYNITVDNNIVCYYSLLDHGALFNLRFLLNTTQAQKLIEQTVSKKYSFKDIYLDWIDRNEFSRINGAEKSDYFLNGYSYNPANLKSFQHADSILLLKDFLDFDTNRTNNIKKYFTTYGSTSMNIFLFDRTMLKSFFPYLNDNEIDELIRLKNNSSLEYRKKYSFLQYEAYGSFPSKIISLNIKCMKETIHSKLTAIVDYRPTYNSSWSILELHKK